MTIKHLVISGGGPSGFVAYGAFKTLCQSGFLTMSDVETIYASSIGSLFCAFITLGYEWEWLDDYIIKRPWDSILEIDPSYLLSTFNDKGLYGIEIIEKVMGPLLTAKNLSPEITLLEYYEYNNTELHMFTTGLNNIFPTSIDMSHKTHPDLPLVQALYRSISFPFIFKPTFDGTECFIDGGLINNFPLQNCIENIKNNCDGKVNYDEILAMNKPCEEYSINVTENTNIIQYGIELFRRMHNLICKNIEQNEISGQNEISELNKIKYIITCRVSLEAGLDSWWDIFANEDSRKIVVSDGEKLAEVFIEKHLKIA